MAEQERGMVLATISLVVLLTIGAALTLADVFGFISIYDLRR